jgi:hypothetical protein
LENLPRLGQGNRSKIGEPWEWVSLNIFPSFAGRRVRSFSTLFLPRRGYNPAQGSPLPSLGGEDFMRQKTFSLVAGLIFLLIAVMHVLRLALKWEVVLNGWSVPMWVSAMAIVITAYLGFESLKLSRRS